MSRVNSALSFSQAASVATLPSALLVSDFARCQLGVLLSRWCLDAAGHETL